MKRLSLTGLALATVILLSACGEPEPPRVQRRPPGGFRPPPQDRVVIEEDTQEETPSRRTTQRDSEPSTEETRTDSEPTTTPPPAPAAPVGNYEYGKAVPGKPGMVTSPYAPYSGHVDVRGFPPGTEVKDPYTNKIFLVP
jgi:hypothetical protein